MSKGRNTTCITIRLDDAVVESLQERAKKQGLGTAGEYIKVQILKSFNHSESTIKKDITDKLKAVGLDIESGRVIKVTKGKLKIPLYNSTLHKAGDRVLIQKGKGLIETVIPEVDAEGDMLPEY